jgi:hypothetical protein
LHICNFTLVSYVPQTGKDRIPPRGLPGASKSFNRGRGAGGSSNGFLNNLNTLNPANFLSAKTRCVHYVVAVTCYW